VKFFVGMHQPHSVRHVTHPACVSYQRLRARRSDFVVNEWLLDSGAFTEVALRGGYRDAPEVYAAAVVRWAGVGRMLAAVSQDYMCEPFVLAKTGLTLRTHQRLTIERYDAIRAAVPASIHILPVLQGFMPSDYVRHIADYGSRLVPGMWVGVGSVCKRNANVRDIAAVLRAIKAERPDLRLHGFGVKLTALQSHEVRSLLHSADSMAWSSAARWAGEDANDWHNAQKFADRIVGGASLDSRPMEALWNG
jgi:hypothetical protein